MLSTKNRLTAKKDFDCVQKNGRMTQSESFGVLVYNRKDENPTRFGIVISKKVSPLANKRNYIKRAISESLRQNISKMKDGYDGVFLVKPEASKKYMNELMPETVEVIKKARLFK